MLNQILSKVVAQEMTNVLVIGQVRHGEIQGELLIVPVLVLASSLGAANLVEEAIVTNAVQVKHRTRCLCATIVVGTVVIVVENSSAVKLSNLSIFAHGKGLGHANSASSSGEVVKGILPLEAGTTVAIAGDRDITVSDITTLLFIRWTPISLGVMSGHGYLIVEMSLSVEGSRVAKILFDLGSVCSLVTFEVARQGLTRSVLRLRETT